jgi:carboxymethylenebutenolidase
MGAFIQIPAANPGETMDAYLAEPAQKAKIGIVVIQEILGVNPGIRAMTDAWTAQGYAAIAPDLFWRLHRRVELNADIPEEFQEALALMQRFDGDLGVKDIAASIRALRESGCDKVGVVGYCLGGRLSFMAAARTDSDASVAYYGVGLDGLLGESGNIRKPLMLHIAKQDKFVPAEAQAKVHAGLKGNTHVAIYDYDADHAFARHVGSSRVPALADQADKRTRDFFTANLG